MQTILFDSNSIIDIEESRDSSPYLLKLIEMHNSGKIQIKFPAISASEKQKEGGISETFQEYVDRINNLGVFNPEISPCPFYWDLSYWECHMYVDANGEKLLKEIERILFKDFEFDWLTYAKSNNIESENRASVEYQNWERKWRNFNCDILAYWTAIHFDFDVFITRDHNFHKQSKKPLLLALGHTAILKPQEALLMVQSNEEIVLLCDS